MGRQARTTCAHLGGCIVLDETQGPVHGASIFFELLIFGYQPVRSADSPIMCRAATTLNFGSEINLTKVE